MSDILKFAEETMRVPLLEDVYTGRRTEANLGALTLYVFAHMFSAQRRLHLEAYERGLLTNPAGPDFLLSQQLAVNAEGLRSSNLNMLAQTLGGATLRLQNTSPQYPIAVRQFDTHKTVQEVTGYLPADNAVAVFRSAYGPNHFELMTADGQARIAVTPLELDTGIPLVAITEAA